MNRYTRTDIRKFAKAAEERGKDDPARHRCFVSYHVADTDIAAQFILDFGDVFIPTVLGITEDDDFVDSSDEDYIKQQIREKHLSTTSVTIVIAGECTWARKFIDWEIASSLRNDTRNKRSGLLALTLPDATKARLPDRVRDNWDGDVPSKSYAEFWVYPKTEGALRGSIQAAFDARITKADVVDNTRKLMSTDKPCP